MLQRLGRRLELAGFTREDSSAVLDVVGDALGLRARALGDEHFETLHPARTLLILLDDCELHDADALVAAASIDSEHAGLRPRRSSELAGRVPLPDHDGDRLLEELVAADTRVRLIALAERLDHARHLHLRDRSSWPGFHAGIGSVYGPVAARTHDRLARRYDWWWRTFRDRFLSAAEPR